MAFSLGELFVSLGFDVDDAKLKAFNDQIKDAQRSLIAVGEAAAAAVVGVGEFIAGPISKASQFKQFADQTGYSSEAMQEWARTISLVNRTVSFDQALAKYQAFTDYVMKIPLGQAGGGLAQLIGDQFQMGQDPSIYLNQLSAVARSGKWAELWGTQWRSVVIPKLREMGLGGETIDALLTTAGQRQSMTAGMIQTPEQSAHLDEINRQFGEMVAQYESFAKDVTVTYGPKILETMKELEKELPKIRDDINEIIDKFGGWKGVGELVLLYFGTTWVAGMLGSFATVLTALGKVEAAAVAGTGLAAGIAARGIGALRFLGIGGLLAASAYTGFEVGKNIMEATGWGDQFANWAIPPRGPNVLQRTSDAVHNFLNPPPTSSVDSATGEITININSNSNPEEIGREVQRRLDEVRQRQRTQAYDQSNLGASY